MTALSIRRDRRRRIKAEINVVPYIDVMLVLLVVFMVTAPLLTLGIDIELPRSDARSVAAKEVPTVVSVYPDGTLALAAGSGKAETMTPAVLEARVVAIVKQNQQASVFVAGNGEGRYQDVMDVMALLQRANVKRIGLISQPKQVDGR
ncbi:MAG: ExbD/TolR family protein [Arenimonas sp.]|jgi:biopolymer transport protein TolR